MHILTFDIEEWFHILDNESTRTVNEWKNYESRIHSNMERLYQILKKHDVKATFFCLGWIGERYPEIIKDIVSLGHEIGSHTYMHQLVYEQNPQQFKDDIKKSIDILENITGQKIVYFRAPGFSIGEDNKWAFEILAENGIEVDCSIFPAPRAHGGFPSYQKPVPTIIHYNGVTLKELPINYVRLLSRPVIFSGGGYFRLFPYTWIRKWSSQSDYVMTYMHPRDFDHQQPMINDLPLARKFKSYVGLKGAYAKLDRWMQDFPFISVGQAVESICWEKVPVINL